MTAALGLLSGGPLTIAGIPKSLHECDEFTRKLGCPVTAFVRIALQDELDRAANLDKAALRNLVRKDWESKTTPGRIVS
jgi:hypothetical protein